MANVERANQRMMPRDELPADSGATVVVLPETHMPPVHVGQRGTDAQQICADDAEPVDQIELDAHGANADGPGHLLHDAHIRLAGPDTRSEVVSGSTVGPDQVGHVVGDTRDKPADLDLALLHASLGHYSRQLLDIQKVRIAMGNRVSAMERDEIPESLIAHARATADGLARLELDISRYLERSVRRHPMADWIKAQRGIGLPGFARLLGITGPLDRFATVSKLWAYLGLHVVDGAAPRRQKGERANWSPAGRVLCHQIAESIVKVGAAGPYRAAYDRKKTTYESDRPEWAQARRHNAAMRYAIKELLKAMWIEWRRTMTPEPARGPAAATGPAPTNERSAACSESATSPETVTPEASTRSSPRAARRPDSGQQRQGAPHEPRATTSTPARTSESRQRL